MNNRESLYPDDLLDHVLTSAVGSLFNDATEAEIAQMEQLVLDDDRACKLYVDTILDSLVLRRWSDELPDSALIAPAGFLSLIADQDVFDVTIPGLDGGNQSSLLSPLPAPLSSLPSFASGWPVAYLIATVIFGLGLVIGAIVHVSRPAQVVQQSDAINAPNPQSPIPNPSPKAPIVGRITGMVDCDWEGAGFSVQGVGTPKQKSLLRLGDTLALRTGLLEITYDSGAKVILEGPITYEVESPAGGYLSIGRLTARLEKSEVRGQRSESANQKLAIINHQFSIRTPTAVVTDLGTEFGVEVDRSGATHSHVFRGVIRVQATSRDGKPFGDAKVLHDNQAARVPPDGEHPTIVVVPAAEPIPFVRDVPRPTITTLDLVDVVAGGDGYSGRRNRGIDATTGLPRDWPPKQEILPGDDRYHRVEGMPFVDGLFVPNGSQGPVQVDSGGHRFDGFRATTGTTSNLVWAGGFIPTDHPGLIVPTVLGGVDYGSVGHGLLFLHSNKGITFDLDAIRRANSRRTLLRFRAVAGNLETASASGSSNLADAWVLVDGKMRFRRCEINAFNGAFPVVIPLKAADRFLTLVATDAGDGIETDWIVFGDPRLEFVSGQPMRESAVTPR